MTLQVVFNHVLNSWLRLAINNRVHFWAVYINMFFICICGTRHHGNQKNGRKADCDCVLGGTTITSQR